MEKNTETNIAEHEMEHEMEAIGLHREKVGGWK